MNNHVGIEDESGDRKYFSLLPHYILNHSTAVDQSLYMQMKRYVGEDTNGDCFVSKNTLMKQMGVGRKALDKSINYLLKRGWIYEKGYRLTMTKGGPQKVQVFGVKDIWKMNVEHYEDKYKGASKRTYPISKGVSKEHKGTPERASNKNHSNKKETSNEVLPTEEQRQRMNSLKESITRSIKRA